MGVIPASLKESVTHDGLHGHGLGLEVRAQALNFGSLAFRVRQDKDAGDPLDSL